MIKPTLIPRRRSAKGAILITVVLGLIILGALGATMAGLSSTANVEQPYAKPSREAFYAAEAGIRIVASEYNKVAENDDRTNLLSSIHGKTFTLDQDTNEQFTMNIYSYGFRVISHDSTHHIIVAQAVDKVPLRDLEDADSSTITFPSGTMISVQDEVGNDVPVYLASNGIITNGGSSPDRVTFTYTPPTSGLPLDASGDLDFVSIANHTDSTPTGTAEKLTGLPSGMANFPPRNGRIAIHQLDKTYTYRTLKVESSGSVTLTGLTPEEGTFSLNDFRNQTLLLRKTYGFQSTGSYGSGRAQASKTVAYYDSPTEDPDVIDADADAAGPTILMYDVSDFNSADLRDNSGNNVVAVQAYTSSQGDHTYYAAIHSLCTNPRRDTPCEHILRLNRQADFIDRWVSDTRLSYDVQVKIGSGWKLPFGMSGLLVRYHEISGQPYFYGFSFMKYLDPNERDLPNGVVGDHIPDELKPPGLGTTIPRNGWRNAPEYEGSDDPLNITETDHILLVFWRQAGSSRQWLAYKDVTDDLAVYPKQWSGDGRIVSDNTTLLVRVEEQFVLGQKVNRIKVFYGDASYQIRSYDPDHRSRDALPYNIIIGNRERGRGAYQPEWNADRDNDFPLWPPFTIGDWSAAEDYFTHIQKADYEVNGSLRTCTWDGVNTSAIESSALAASDIRILSDGATIRSQEFLTPNSSSWPASSTAWPSNRAEIAFHAAGRMITYSYNGRYTYNDPYNYAATFDDLTYRFLFYN